MEYDLPGFVPWRLFQTDSPLAMQTLQMQVNIKKSAFQTGAVAISPRAIINYDRTAESCVIEFLIDICTTPAILLL